jgi:hypothetical protein
MKSVDLPLADRKKAGRFGTLLEALARACTAVKLAPSITTLFRGFACPFGILICSPLLYIA